MQVRNLQVKTAMTLLFVCFFVLSARISLSLNFPIKITSTIVSINLKSKYIPLYISKSISEKESINISNIKTIKILKIVYFFSVNQTFYILIPNFEHYIYKNISNTY